MSTKLNLNDVKALIIDMDGVLWRGTTPLPGLQAFFEFLHSKPIPYMLATNNASKTQAQYQERFAGYGVTIKRDRVLTSSLATAAYLQDEFGGEGKAYVVGGAGIQAAVREAGFTVVPDVSQPVKVVVAGIDFDLTYDKLKYAVLHIQRGAKFVATNSDHSFPSEDGYYPGAGAILAAIEIPTKVKPTVIGKPGELMFKIAIQKMGSDLAQTAMLGDKLETDILGGQRVGLKTIMVTSGVDSEEAIAEKGIQPDIVFSGIDALVKAWQALG